MYENYTRYQKLWLVSAHKIISQKLKTRLDRILKGKDKDIEPEIIRELQWRLAYNQFKSLQFTEALQILKILFYIPKDVVDTSENLSQYYLTAAKSCSELFALSKDHSYLQSAYQYYELGIQHMTFDLWAMFKLPQVLHEYGRVMENYGSFEGALAIYSRIMSNFPNYRGYFHVMYRLAIVGKYIAEMAQVNSDTKRAQEFNDQCIDILQFLLEALPIGISTIHIVLLYIKCLEFSANPANRFRASTVYQSLYDNCMKASPPLASVFKHKNFRDWEEDPMTWRELGDHAYDLREPLVARDCYQIYVEKVQMRRIKKEIENLNVEMLMKIAKNCADFQGYEDATKYGLMALKLNYVNKEVRKLLVKWSPQQAQAIQREENAISTIESLWKNRWLTPGYRKRYSTIVVSDLESKYSSNKLDFDNRKWLAYFAKDKWRAKFVFENECARKIQHQFRRSKLIWQWQAALRARYTGWASDALRKFAKTPYKRDLRQDIRRIANHRMCSRKHAIKKLLPILDTQDAARTSIWKSYRAYRVRCGLYVIIMKRRNIVSARQEKAAILIQSIIRMFLCKVEANKLRTIRDNRIKAATTIQQYYLNRNKTFYHSVYRIIARIQRVKRQKMLFLHYALLSHFRKHFRRKIRAAKRNLSAVKIQRKFRAWLLRANVKIHRNMMAIRIQRMIRRQLQMNFRRLTKFALKHRKLIQFSGTSDSLLESLTVHPKSQMDTSCGPACYYRSPGFRQNTQQYISVLCQHTVYCTMTFSSDDCILLSGVLRNVSCKIRRLIFHCVDGKPPSFEFDLLPAIIKCKSLRDVNILGGYWTDNFLVGLFSGIENDNARIIHVTVESVKTSNRNLGEVVGLSVGKLVGNFFNYSVPGLQVLTLHGLSMKDVDIAPLAEALRVNSALKTLILSLNMIEDHGLMNLFKAFTSNRKSSLRELDLRMNLVTCGDEVKKMFDAYEGSDYPGKEIAINLQFNTIINPYVPQRITRMDLRVMCSEVARTKPKRVTGNHRNSPTGSAAGSVRKKGNQRSNKLRSVAVLNSSTI